MAGPLLLICAGMARTEIIDRIAVSVGNQVITEDQIKEEIRVTAFLNHAKPVINPAQKRKAAERLIEQALIRGEIDFSHYPLPGMAEADESLKKVQSEYGSQGDFETALQACGITEQELRRHLWWQQAVLHFIDYRFRAGIQVRDADVTAYYEEQLAKWKKEGVEPPSSLEDMRPKIQQIVEQQHLDQALDRWLGDARTQVGIHYHAGAFE